MHLAHVAQRGGTPGPGVRKAPAWGGQLSGRAKPRVPTFVPK